MLPTSMAPAVRAQAKLASAAGLAASGCLLALAMPAFAQQSAPPAATAAASPQAQQVAQAAPAQVAPVATASDAVALPPVVVQGATLAAPAPARKKPTVDNDPPPPPTPEPVKAKKVKPAPKPEPVAAKPKSKPTGGGTQTGGASATGGGNASGGDSGAYESGASAADGTNSGSSTSGDTAGGIGGGTPVERQGASVTVLTRADIEAQQTRSAVELLRALPGVNVTRTGSAAGLTTVSLRGGGSQHTLVLIDGMEANDPSDGAFDFSNLASDDIERIEVIRGPMSGIYGSKAVGGVINILTRGGRGPLTLQARVEAGSQGTTDVSGRVSGGNDRAWIAASVSARKTHGFNIAPAGGDELDGARQTTLSLRAGVQIVDGVTLDVTVRNMKKSGDRDGFMSTGGLATAFDDPSTFSTNVWMTGANLRWDSMDGALTQMFKVARTQTTNTDLDLSFPAFPFASANEGIVTRYGYLTTYRFATPGVLGARHTVTALIERETEEFTPSGDFADGLHRERNRNSVAGEYSVDLLDRLTLSGNVRHDGNESFQDYDTWRAAASLRLPEIGLRPHASVGTAVKFPTMFEQFGSTGLFQPNPLLKPEESFGWDAGVELTFARGLALVDVTYFENTLTNSITTTFSPKFTAINLAGESQRRGVEVAARARLTRELTLGGAYTWLDARDPDGAQSIRRAPHTGRADLNYAFLGGKANLNAAAIYNSGGLDIGLNPDFSTTRVALHDYWLVNLAASYKIAPGVELFARGENLLDAKYQELFGYNTSGITAFAGVKLTYEDPATASWAKYK